MTFAGFSRRSRICSISQVHKRRGVSMFDPRAQPIHDSAHPGHFTWVYSRHIFRSGDDTMSAHRSFPFHTMSAYLSELLRVRIRVVWEVYTPPNRSSPVDEGFAKNINKRCACILYRLGCI
jgi:hypothetical protein